MNYIVAAVYGIVQGITEFLPVSSSGHLVILHKFIPLPVENELSFDVILHLATLLAVIWVFRFDLVKLFRSWVRSFRGKMDASGKLSWLILLATIPAGLAGWLFEARLESIRNTGVVAVMLVLVGLLFIVFEKISRQTDKLDKMTWRKALIVGAAQALALIPGTSRSGITIIAGLGAGLRREAAVKFSFLLSIPIIFGASATKIPEIFNAGQLYEETVLLAVGFIFAAISGVFAIKYFLHFARNRSLFIFAVYRFILAAVVVALCGLG